MGSQASTFRMLNPVHPGEFIKEEIIEAYELSISQAAEALGVTRVALSRLLNARGALSPGMAIRIEKAFGVKMDTLMRMQADFDIAKARKDADLIQISPYIAQPIAG